jgi:LAO/AO transport system kinase
VDPSSHISGGSILGDKTRMEQLSRTMKAYIRASPTRGVLGGIGEHTADVIALCEYAHFNVIIVESVGLGQSEVDIDEAVDLLLLVVPPSAGDSLQASKKGIMEAADMILVNKADGELLSSAKHTKADYSGAMQFIRYKHYDWKPKVMLMSAQTEYNLDEVLNEILRFHDVMTKNNGLQEKRQKQKEKWFHGQLQRMLYHQLENNEQYRQNLAEVKQSLLVNDGKYTTSRSAANRVMQSIQLQVQPLEKDH